MADKLLTPEVRLAFPYLFTPRDPMANSADQTKKYQACLIFDAEAQKTPEFARLVAATKTAIATKWPKGAPAGARNPFRPGKERSDEGYEGFPEGSVFINVTTKQKPGLVDRQRQPIIEENEIYAGCYVRASLTCYAYDKMGNKGIAFGLNNIQKLRDGPSLGGRSRPDEDFEPLGPEPGQEATAGAVTAGGSVADLFK